MQHELFHFVWLCHMIKWSSYNKRKKKKTNKNVIVREMNKVVWYEKDQGSCDSEKETNKAVMVGGKPSWRSKDFEKSIIVRSQGLYRKRENNMNLDNIDEKEMN